MSTSTQPAVRHFSRYAADYIWWYHPTGPIEVSVDAGVTWHSADAGLDPKGKAGFSAYFTGPESDRTGISLALGENLLVSRSVGDPQSAVVTTFRVD